MAKGNLFQGQARGRVGDVVLSRLDGQQVSRVRNRNPRIPNTYRQRLQRAVAANIARLYSAGSDIFNHSWQGSKVGSGAQRRFLKRNMRLLRRLLLADIDNDALSVDSIARVGVPGLSVPVPFAGLQVSAGSLSQEVFSLSESSAGVFWKPRIPAHLAQDTTIADYCRLVGLKPGNIFTFIGFNVKSSADYLAKVANDDNNYDAVFPCVFEYAQLRLKESALTDTTPISSARYGMMFDGVDDSQIGGLLVFNGFRVTYIFGNAYAAGDTILTACIASKQNSPKRSTAFLMNVSGSAHYGLTHQFISSAWDKSADLDGSDLILEGEKFQPTPAPHIVNNGDFLCASYWVDSAHNVNDCLVAFYSDGSMRPITVGGKVILATAYEDGFDHLEFSPSPLDGSSTLDLYDFIPYENEGEFGGYTNPLECTIEISDDRLKITLAGDVISYLVFGDTSPQSIQNLRQYMP